ncbi:Stk1 family PASTA domain-containing Ser/Thr kinase [Sporosalibacterium faouarense]|uniref:Stk1 family PASTA domain-containing Ser/Thr kinase n=1 Tax=Sporosalibacterium faouarense TaxID=516123 RepID=UPI00141C58CD|nr:Stk1 family PASTA domain-containing Ser/Thr kinase [Sporosalibacterium faouarense]MTI47720.1 Stk1 family PASTA domain-containing Ser/Thr kinase [Bacillota bacterium]
MIGKVLGNRYEIVEKIGGGGMALVYKAKCRLLNRFVAIKVLRREFIHDDEFIAKFKRESQAAASLSHPNIVNVYDVGVEDDIYYIVMEYVKGKTLKEFIQEKGKLTVDETMSIAVQIADGLSHAHKNHIVHRDIKPHNILITDDGRAKVTDFGIAQAATSATVTSTSSVIGSVHYFSPEQARGGYVDEKSDIYSLGIVMYEMVTGKLPFQGDSPISVALKHVQENIASPKIINESIPRSLEKIIMQCVKKDQTLRYSNTEKLLYDLKQFKNLNDEDFIDIDNINDSPTITIPSVKDEDIMSKSMSRTEKNNNNKDEKQNSKKKNNKLVTVAAVFSAILLATVLGGGYIYIQLNDYLTVEEVKVPDVRGLAIDIAKERIEDIGLEFKVKREEFNSEYKADHVIEQSVTPGTKRKVNFPIEVVVSKGEKLIPVPSLEKKLLSDITITLDNYNLEVGDVKYDNNSEFPRNVIISQDPAPSTEVPENSKINLIVSAGPKTNTVLMTNLIGSNVEDAKNEITSLGLVVGSIDYQESEKYEVDIVINQSISSGTEVAESQTVSLIVSSGSGEKSQETSGQNNDSSNTDNSNGEEEKSVSISVPLPKNKDKVHVKVKKVQGINSKIVYDKEHNTSEEKIWVTVTGTGRTVYKIYFDGIEFFEKEINFEEVN